MSLRFTAADLGLGDRQSDAIGCRLERVDGIAIAQPPYQTTVRSRQ